ncbi:MAG: hypothetical protein M3Y93_02130 [Pseudomonadota bacterium]|nr:hypothetical protein [Pseudomonadota bacterium]
MRFLQLVVFAFFVSLPAVWATGGQTPVKPVSGGRATGRALDQFRQQQLKNQAEVDQLKHDVDTQQSSSAEAGKRLQRQDQAIAELRKQLRQLKVRPPAGQH